MSKMKQSDSDMHTFDASQAHANHKEQILSCQTRKNKKIGACRRIQKSHTKTVAFVQKRDRKLELFILRVSLHLLTTYHVCESSEFIQCVSFSVNVNATNA